ncbi:hypothetical protein ABBQ38_004262 [Trebouxia sp. C0009 RCD-2024]
MEAPEARPAELAPVLEQQTLPIPEHPEAQPQATRPDHASTQWLCHRDIFVQVVQ